MLSKVNQKILKASKYNHSSWKALQTNMYIVSEGFRGIAPAPRIITARTIAPWIIFLDNKFFQAKYFIHFGQI